MPHGNKVLLDIQDSIALIPLNKPDRPNALDPGLWMELKSAAEAVAAAPQVRAAILTGAGPGIWGQACIYASAASNPNEYLINARLQA